MGRPDPRTGGGMKGDLLESDVLLMIEDEIERWGSAKKVAARMKISQQYLHDIRHGRRAIGRSVLKAFSLKRVCLYRPVK